MAQPVIAQELTLSGNGLTAGLFAEVPQSLVQQFTEFTVYVQFSAGVTAGKFQIKTAFRFPIPSDGYAYSQAYEPELASLVWANVGSTIDWAAASSQKYANVTGVFSALRVYIDTTVANGTARVGIICGRRE